MEKTLAQQIAELTARIREVTALRDTGMQCQSELERVRGERDKLYAKQEANNETRSQGG